MAANYLYAPPGEAISKMFMERQMLKLWKVTCVDCDDNEVFSVEVEAYSASYAVLLAEGSFHESRGTLKRAAVVKGVRFISYV